jgi:signal transduction histidine kinase
MARPLRLLIVEDSDDDAALVLRELRAAGYAPAFTRVQDQAGFKAAINAGPLDVIVSDYTLPGYGGLAALRDLQASGKDIPFILVSGTIGETVAVEAMKAGARDYVLKSDLTRLAMAVTREVHESAIRADQAKMRERLVISERMASAGTLAAGVAHEINNPLGVAMANVEFVSDVVGRVVRRASDPKGAADDVGESDRLMTTLDEPLREALEALARIRDIVRDVKLFSRPHDDATTPVDVRRVLDSSTRMAWNEIRHRAKLVKDYGDVPMVNANESRLGQVLLNLVVNAAQAIAEGQADNNEIRVSTWTTEDGKIAVEVSDTGSGIAKENLDRIFDPFFTTKAVGVGTGLGLAICHRIITELGGHISVESEVGKGSRFRLLLPATGATARPPKVPTPMRPTPQRKRILVVDDEETLGRAIQRSLSPDHDVVVLTRARDALSMVEAGERFDVILTDVMMPEVTGMEMYERLRQMAPEQAQRVVFLTGGAFTPAAREFLDTVPNPIVEKPFDPKSLRSIIAQFASSAVSIPSLR